MVVTDLARTADEHRDQLTVTRFERRVAVDVDNCQVKGDAGLQFAQAGNHVVAQVAVRAPVYSQLNGVSTRCETGYRARYRRAAPAWRRSCLFRTAPSVA